MRPDVDTPARQATRSECRMAALMVDLVSERRFADALGCRAELARLAARRSMIATAELDHLKEGFA